MTRVNRLIGAALGLMMLAGTMVLTSCASSSTITVNFVTAGGALPDAIVGTAYSTNVYADGVSGPPTGVYTYALNSGSLPSGMALTTVNTLGVNDTSAGVISGKDTNALDHGKTFTFTLSATDGEKPSHVGISPSYTITVN